MPTFDVELRDSLERVAASVDVDDALARVRTRADDAHTAEPVADIERPRRTRRQRAAAALVAAAAAAVVIGAVVARAPGDHVTTADGSAPKDAYDKVVTALHHAAFPASRPPHAHWVFLTNDVDGHELLSVQLDHHMIEICDLPTCGPSASKLLRTLDVAGTKFRIE